MGLTGRHVLAICALGALAACGGKGGSSSTPTSPSSSLTSPSNFRIVLQRVFFTSNEVQFSWTGNGTSYRLIVGSTPGGSDVLTAETAATNYTWNAPRVEAVYYVRALALRGTETSSSTPEFPVYTMDLRNVIDAIFFRSGPMADTPSNANTNPYAAVWPDGTQIKIQVSPEAGQASRTNSDVFTGDWASTWGGGVTASSEMSTDDFKSVSLSQVAPYNVLMRVLTGFCSSGAIACAYYGPSPVGLNKSIVTMNGTGGHVAIAHEVGHAYGLGHVHVNASVRAELNFLMNPALVNTQLTDPEKNAIAAARAGGLAPGWRRDQAIAAGIVLPYTGSVAGAFGEATISSLPRDTSRCTVTDQIGRFGG